MHQRLIETSEGIVIQEARVDRSRVLKRETAACPPYSTDLPTNVSILGFGKRPGGTAHDLLMDVACISIVCQSDQRRVKVPDCVAACTKPRKLVSLELNQNSRQLQAGEKLVPLVVESGRGFHSSLRTSVQ